MICWEKGRFLHEFSTFGIGGPIALFAAIRSREEALQAVVEAEKKGLPLLVVGKGSNCLFPDAGFPGAVLWNKIDFCLWKETKVSVGAGYSFSLLGVQSAKKGLSGLEFASGIPASVGGAVYMNAGAGGQETADVLEEVEAIDLVEKRFVSYPKSSLLFRYRHSPFQEKKTLLVSAQFALHPSSEARTRQHALLSKRIQSQPYKEKSAGCVFRNPPGLSAGALIEQCGLKGARLGGAEVSSMHANFFINRGGARAQDVKELIAQVQKVVYEKTGVSLELEIRVFDG